MTTIPNELKINVRTSVPGHQVFRLEPSMIMKNVNKDASICFNPLIKLNKSVVNKVPEYLRKKQFVDKGLFESLIRFTNSTPAKSLLEAKKNGYIDNNIDVTLNTIMPGETVITIGGRQYVIVDLQWTKGSWKLDTKRKPVQYDINKITDPFIFNAIISDEIVKGENELNALPNSVVYGANYTGPKNVVAGLLPTVPTTSVATSVATSSGIGGPPGGPPGSPQGIGGPVAPYPTLPAPISAADIAAAVAAAVAALPPPPAAPALPAPPTPAQIADAIIASLRTLAAGGFGYIRPGGPYDIRLIMEDAARAVHAALPPSPPPPALPAPPTALQIADAIRAAILALPPPPAPVVNVAPPIVNVPALPAPPTYPALMPPPANDIENILKRFLPRGIKSSTRKNISSGIVSSMVSAYSSSIPSSSASGVPSRSASKIETHSSSVPPYSTDSDSDSESSSVNSSRGSPNMVPFSIGSPSPAATANSSPAATGLQTTLTSVEINSIIELSLLKNRSAIDIADKLLKMSVPPHIICVFFTVKNLKIPNDIAMPNLINDTRIINSYINDNIDKISDSTIYDVLLRNNYPRDLIQDVFVARNKTIGKIPGAADQKISAQKISEGTQLETTGTIPLFKGPLSFKNKIAYASNFLVRKCYSGDFYNLLNTLFINSEDYLKDTLRNVLRNSTSVNVKTGVNLSQDAYNETVDNLVIVANTGGGNCFFIAVEQAINFYNSQNQFTRIIYKHYGVGENKYTQETIREIIYDYYTNEDPNIQHSLNEFFTNAQAYVENLNDIFDNTIRELQPHFADEQHGARVYRETLIDTYKGNQNFLTTSDFLNPHIPIPQRSNPLYYKPYKLLEREDLRKYMLSDNYWAGGEAITALCSKHTLKLQVIPLNIGSNCRIINTSNSFDLFENDWNRYLFLYENSGHFELMTFNYLTQHGVKGIKLKKTIFVRDDSKSTGIPPIYILFTIYGMLYSNLIEDSNNFQKQNFPYNKPLMDAFENTIKQIKSRFSQEDYTKFYTSFMKYFPNSRIPNPTDKGGSILKDIHNQEGGYTTPYNYNRNRYPQYPQYTKNAIKVPDTSQLAYYITIDLQLQPGTSISPEEKKNLNCNHKWNTVRKSYSQLFGKQYNPKPDYSLLAPQKNNNSTSKQKPSINQYATRKYRENPLNYGGKKRKTLKRRKTKKIIKGRKTRKN